MSFDLLPTAIDGADHAERVVDVAWPRAMDPRARRAQPGAAASETSCSRPHVPMSPTPMGMSSEVAPGAHAPIATVGFEPASDAPPPAHHAVGKES